MIRVPLAIFICLVTACGAATGLDDAEGDAAVGPPITPAPSVACGPLTCRVPEEACHACATDPEGPRCVPAGSDYLPACLDDPFDYIVAACDGPEDCDGFDCEAYGTAFGPLMIQCSRSRDRDGICHSEADCAGGSSCGEGFGEYRHCR